MDTKSIELIEELPQETTSLRRSDYPLHVTLKDGREKIVLIEIQTEFEQNFAYRLIEYTARFRIKYGLEVTPCVMLFTPSNQAIGSYNDGILAINYQAIKFWELNSLDYLNEIWLYLFLPLMSKGENLLLEAEKTIYESSDISNENKADLLTAMAILTGFKDKEIALELIKRRRDIMMQSPTYEILIEEIEKERKDKWIQQGLERGLEEGLEKGLQEGMQQGLQRSILETLEIKFGSVSADLLSNVKAINNIDSLWILHRHAVKCESLHEFEEKLNKATKNEV